MENSLLYPEGWKYREFVGIFRNSTRTAKKIRMTDNTIVDQVMAESGTTAQTKDQQLHSLQQQLMQGQGNSGDGGQHGVGQGQVGDEPVQPAQAAQ